MVVLDFLLLSAKYSSNENSQVVASKDNNGSNQRILTFYNIYLFLCTQSADSNHSRGLAGSLAYRFEGFEVCAQLAGRYRLT